MYCDSAYIAKYYVKEVDSAPVRTLIDEAARRSSSAWALVEVTSAIHRHVRQGALSVEQGNRTMELFRAHASAGVWELVPITETLLRKTAALFRILPPNLPLRAGDALHVATALDAAETDIWSSDRHLLAAANHFGLKGRSVSE
jgi:predicted nucleic acid-binding protein